MTYFSSGGSYQLSSVTLGIAPETVVIDRHHMTNRREYKRSKRKLDWSGGWNILRMKRDRHENLHYYFGNLKWEDIRHSIKTGRMFRRKKFRNLNRCQVQEVLFSIFGRTERDACVKLMDRVSLAKHRNVHCKVTRR